MASLKRAAAEQVTRDLDLCNDLLGFTSAILPPVAALEGDDDHFQLPCSEAISEALQALASNNDESAENGDEVIVRNRRRHLIDASLIQEAMEVHVENEMINMVRDGTIPLNVQSGGIADQDGESVEDPSAPLRELLNGELSGELACLAPESIEEDLERRRRLTESSYQFLTDLIEAPTITCNDMTFAYDVKAYDQSGISDPVRIYIVLQFTSPELGFEPIQNLQTRCADDSIDAIAFEADNDMFVAYGTRNFRPSINYAICPHPYTRLEYEDSQIRQGNPCTKDYSMVRREWIYSNSECPGYSGSAFEQAITMGGLQVDGEPATPYLGLRDQTYQLPNERNAAVRTNLEDFLYPDVKEDVDAFFECGLCEDLQYSHPEDFMCSEVGENTISVTATNGIGVSFTTEATVTVEDNFSPNLITKPYTVYLNQFGWLDEEDVAVFDNLDGGTWDNCGILSTAISPADYLYQCGDEGPQPVLFSVQDSNGNSDEIVTTLMVDDSSRLAVEDYKRKKDDPELPFELTQKGDEKRLDKSIEKHVKEEFDLKYCKEVGVHIRPQGQSNFVPLDLSMVPLCPEGYYPKDEDIDPEAGLFFTGEEDFELPEYDEWSPRSEEFHRYVCGGTPLIERGAEPCIAEIKGEVMCEVKGSKSAPKTFQQTCYRVVVTSVDECPEDDEVAESCPKTKPSKKKGSKMCKANKNM